MSHASIPADVRAARGLPDDLVRISVGIEDPEDLLQGEPSEAYVVLLVHQKYFGSTGGYLVVGIATHSIMLLVLASPVHGNMSVASVLLEYLSIDSPYRIAARHLWLL
jgi:hypothetical protein